MDIISKVLQQANMFAVIDIEDPKWYDAKTKTFSFEVSSLKNDIKGPMKPYVYLRNPKTDKKIRFKFTKADMDSTQEDTYGWNYESPEGYKLLIIND